MKLNIIEVIDSLNRAQSVISPKVGTHQQRVAYLAYALADKLGFSEDEKHRLYIAGLLHDIGALSMKEKLDAFEGDGETVNVHGHRGAFLISSYHPQPDLAPIIYYHHYLWNFGKVLEEHPDMPIESQLIFVTDRICTMTANYTDAYILTVLPKLRRYLEDHSGTRFYPAYVDALIELTYVESVWLDLISYDSINRIEHTERSIINITTDELVNLACVFSYLIDFRSPHTATHSSGVAKTAEKLAELMHFSPDECKKVLAAGYLHDIGKLTIDPDVLEKQGKLEPSEYEYIKSHVYYTYYLLSGITGLEEITEWAAYHHEKLNGKGYPFHLTGESMSLCSRIMAVADIFAALREKRPYKEPFPKERIISILNEMVANGSIDGNVVGVIADNFELLEETCLKAQEEARQTYDRVYKIV